MKKGRDAAWYKGFRFNPLNKYSLSAPFGFACGVCLKPSKLWKACPITDEAGVGLPRCLPTPGTSVAHARDLSSIGENRTWELVVIPACFRINTGKSHAGLHSGEQE